MKRQRARSIVRAIENPAVGQGAFHGGPPHGRGLDMEARVLAPPLAFRASSHSYLSATAGSTVEARRAGSRHARAAEPTLIVVAQSKITGSRALPSPHLATRPLSPRHRTTPANKPPPTLIVVEANTIQSTCLRCAPSAIRIPNSFVRCATVYETTLYSPTTESSSAKTEKD